MSAQANAELFNMDFPKMRPTVRNIERERRSLTLRFNRLVKARDEQVDKFLATFRDMKAPGQPIIGDPDPKEFRIVNRYVDLVNLRLRICTFRLQLLDTLKPVD